MAESELSKQQAEMRKRWADPLHRLQFGSVNSSMSTAELTLGVTNMNAQELSKKIEEAYNVYVGNKQVIP